MISVLIASMGRPQLAATLKSIAAARLPAGESLQIVVADDSAEKSAASLVAGLDLPIAVRVLAVASRNVAVARNACLDAAKGEWLIFVDDDEIVEPGWLEGHVSAANDFAADAVFGPVFPIYPTTTPDWFVAANPLFQDWGWNEDGRTTARGRTGNTLIRRSALGDLRFNPDYGRTGGEDDEFFLRFAGKGRRMVLTSRARAHEHVPESRATAAYAISRALRTGQIYARLRARRRGLLGFVGFMAVSGAKGLVFAAAGLAVRLVDRPRGFRLQLRAANNLGKLLDVFGSKLRSAWS
jgi:succinoglycan biosynthesis protein ExoM